MKSEKLYNAGKAIPMIMLAGIMVGGVFATYINWKFLFVVPLISLFALPSLIKNLPDECLQKKGKLDLIGLGLLTFFTLLISIYLNIGGIIYLIGSAMTLLLRKQARFMQSINICRQF